MTRTRCLITALLLCSLAATAHAELHIEAPWAREAPPNAGVMAGYLVFTNQGEDDITVSRAYSEDFERVEFHETRQREDGVATMRRLPEVTVPAGGEMAFRPGGHHLMLIAPRRALTAGDEVEITLVSDDGTEAVITMPVRKAHGNDHDHHGGH